MCVTGLRRSRPLARRAATVGGGSSKRARGTAAKRTSQRRVVDWFQRHGLAGEDFREKDFVAAPADRPCAH